MGPRQQNDLLMNRRPERQFRVPLGGSLVRILHFSGVRTFLSAPTRLGSPPFRSSGLAALRTYRRTGMSAPRTRALEARGGAISVQQ